MVLRSMGLWQGMAGVDRAYDVAGKRRWIGAYAVDVESDTTDELWHLHQSAGRGRLPRIERSYCLPLTPLDRSATDLRARFDSQLHIDQNQSGADSARADESHFDKWSRKCY